MEVVWEWKESKREYKSGEVTAQVALKNEGPKPSGPGLALECM